MTVIATVLGIIPVAVAAKVVTSVTDSAFGAVPKTKKKKTNRSSSPHPFGSSRSQVNNIFGI